MGDGSKGQPSHSFCFLDWTGKLQADLSLTPGLRESYRRTIQDFLQFCEQRRTAPTVAMAREYVEVARLERTPAPARLQEWKDGLNWWLRRGGEALASALKSPKMAHDSFRSRLVDDDHRHSSHGAAGFATGGSGGNPDAARIGAMAST